MIQYDSLYALHNFCLELQSVEQSVCLIGVPDGFRGQSKQSPALFGNCINTGLYQTMKEDFTDTQLRFR